MRATIQRVQQDCPCSPKFLEQAFTVRNQLKATKRLMVTFPLDL